MSNQIIVNLTSPSSLGLHFRNSLKHVKQLRVKKKKTVKLFHQDHCGRRSGRITRETFELSD
jgi:hypothetical protein